MSTERTVNDPGAGELPPPKRSAAVVAAVLAALLVPGLVFAAIQHAATVAPAAGGDWRPRLAHGGLWVFVLMAVGAVFVPWLALVRGRPRDTSPGWLVLGWLIPGAQGVVPYTFAADVARACAGPRTLRLVRVWWGLWLAMWATGWTAWTTGYLAGEDGRGFDGWAAGTDALFHAVAASAAVAAAAVVVVLTRARRRGGRLTGAPRRGPASRARWGHTAIVVACSLWVLPGLASWYGAPHPVPAVRLEAAEPAGEYHDDGPGVLVLWPDGTFAAENVRADTTDEENTERVSVNGTWTLRGTELHLSADEWSVGPLDVRGNRAHLLLATYDGDPDAGRFYELLRDRPPGPPAPAGAAARSAARSRGPVSAPTAP